MDTKICNKCAQALPLDKFSVDKKSSDGKCRSCKVCFKAAYHQNRPPLPKPKKPRNPELLKMPAPSIDEILHCAAVKAGDEISALTMKEDLTNIDVNKMKGLIEILLVFKKKARPIHNEEKDSPADIMNELF